MIEEIGSVTSAKTQLGFGCLGIGEAAIEVGAYLSHPNPYLLEMATGSSIAAGIHFSSALFAYAFSRRYAQSTARQMARNFYGVATNVINLFFEIPIMMGARTSKSLMFNLLPASNVFCVAANAAEFSIRKAAFNASIQPIEGIGLEEMLQKISQRETTSSPHDIAHMMADEALRNYLLKNERLHDQRIVSLLVEDAENVVKKVLSDGIPEAKKMAEYRRLTETANGKIMYSIQT